MSPERTEAYRRVVRTLDDLGPSKLQADEQERIRAAADSLIFSLDLDGDPSAREAVADIEWLCEALVDSGRWTAATAAALQQDVRGCGPAAPLVLHAA